MNSARSDFDSAAGAFEALHPAVQRWIWQQNWDDLRDIQARAIPILLSGEKDLILSAATAAGKTEAAFLPICSRIAGDAGGSVRALYVGPLKALINDQFERLEGLCADLEIPVFRWHGDVASSRKKALLKEPAGILLITPESLEALFVLQGPKLAFVFRYLQAIVIDELHAFFGSERGRQLQSLLHRLERVLGRRIARVGLSATLGDPSLAARFLRSDDAEAVVHLEDISDSRELRMQLRASVSPRAVVSTQAARSLPVKGEDDESDVNNEANEEEEAPSLDDPAWIAIADHLFKVLRGQNHLVFANSRNRVEWFADRLASMCVALKLPNEFLPHHGNLAKELREDAEMRVKAGALPTSIVCTSTLELGIDIGRVVSVVQIGAPPAVASLTQRLGRSGRRGDPAILRAFVAGRETDSRSSLQDRLFPELIQSIAMCNLLLAHWVEPPQVGALHLSTLVQQVLSMISQLGGTTAVELWNALCVTGPFHAVDQSMFMALLRELGRREVLTQSQSGLLLPGRIGERLLGHYDFYSAFHSPDEWRVVADGRQLGTLPLEEPVSERALIIFAGRRWRVIHVDIEQRVLTLQRAGGGRPPLFSGTPGLVHDRVREEMRRIYAGLDMPKYLDRNASQLLASARMAFAEACLGVHHVVLDARDSVLFCWMGDRVLDTMTVQLRAAGCDAERDGVAIRIARRTVEDILHVIQGFASAGLADPLELAATVMNKVREKHDPLLSEALLTADYAAGRLDVAGAWRTWCRISGGRGA